MTHVTNWIESPSDNDWDALLIEHDKDRNTFVTDTASYLIKSDKSWEKIPILVDLCPHKQLIACLATAYVLLTTISYGKNYFGYLMNMLNHCGVCSNLDNKRTYLHSILESWQQTDPISSLESLCDKIFSFDLIGSASASNDDDLLKLYKGAVNALYLAYPNEIAVYLKSEKGQHFLRGIKRLQSVGFQSDKSVEIIEDLVIRQMGLPPIEFEPIDISSVFKRCGWKSYDDDADDDENDDEKITDVLEVGTICYLTNPCQHDVVVLLQNGDHATKTMNINEIQALYSRLGKELPQLH